LQHQLADELGEALAALGGRRAVEISTQCGTSKLAAESALLAASSLWARMAATMWRLTSSLLAAIYKYDFFQSLSLLKMNNFQNLNDFQI
jgi:hypothetical protein